MTTASTNSVHSTAEIQEWLVQTFSKLLGVEPDQIDVNEPLSFLGLESIEAITIAGELTEWLGYEITPTLVWDYQTINEIADFLSSST